MRQPGQNPWALVAKLALTHRPPHTEVDCGGVELTFMTLIGS